LPKLPAGLDPGQITAVIDTREQLPLDLSPLRTVTATLPAGDYSLQGAESTVAVERKSLPDLVMCVGRERARFDRMVQRLLGYESKALVVEATWDDIDRGGWRGQVLPQAVQGSLIGWQTRGLPVFLAGNHAGAAQYVVWFLTLVACRRWREVRRMVATIGGGGDSIEQGKPG
jgi:ERCC4-type nuclease